MTDFESLVNESLSKAGIELERDWSGFETEGTVSIDDLHLFAKLIYNKAIDIAVEYMKNKGFGRITCEAMKENLK